MRTLDILAENGIEYVGNWVNDEQPYPMQVKKGSMISMPYSSEINDIPALLGLHQSPERFGQMICDQFDVLYEDGAKTGRVMSICLHPFLIGHPHRSKYFAKALAHITSRQEVWLATGSEIIDWYKKNYLKKVGVLSHDRLAARVGGALDLDQHADAGVGADVLLLALGVSLAKIASWIGPISCSSAVPQNRRKPNSSILSRCALKFEYITTTRRSCPRFSSAFFFGPFPIGEVLVVEHDHAALGADVRAVLADGRQHARIAVVPGVVDKRLDRVAERHPVCSLGVSRPAGRFRRPSRRACVRCSSAR